jgi:mutator protein MutT
LSIGISWNNIERNMRAMKTREGKTKTVTAAVIERDGKVLVARRKAGLIAGGLWEFPGGKLEDGEDPRRGLERELEEELGVGARAGELLCSVPFEGQTTGFELVVFKTELDSDDFRPTDHDQILWLEPSEMDERVFSKPDRPVVRLLAGRGGAAEGPKGKKAA